MKAKTFAKTVGMFGAAFACTVLMAGTASSQTASPPTFDGDPSVYKVIYEDANFRVIEGIRKAGVKDKPHGHPLPSIVYNVTECPSKVYTPDGQVRDGLSKAGTATAVPVIPSHQAENIATAECKQIFVEKK